MKRSFSTFALSALLLSLCTLPLQARAASFDVSGWIPYWAEEEGIKDALKHFDVLTTVHPFTFSVDKSGKTKDIVGMNSGIWKRFVRQAKLANIAVIPTVMWSDTANIQKILSDKKLRAAHVESVVQMVKKGGYDGVDIDYEGKLAKTGPAYSAFLTELKTALDGKILSCTIEPRTPPDSLYTVVPKNLEYANDYAVINANCDQVNIMTYDQQRADLKLNTARKGAPYYPVADAEWVKKVIAYTVRSIDADKLSIGIATYGRELEVTVSPNQFSTYKQISSVSDGYARDTANTHDVDPVRNSAGELSYSYVSTKAGEKLLSSVSLTRSQASGDEIAARALAYANKTGKSTTIRTVWWSDADAIAEKIQLAHTLAVRGVAIFKLDGKEDDAMWDSF